MSKAITLEEIEAIPGSMLRAEEVAPFLGVNPQSIRQQAQRDPLMLGFPVIVIMTRVIIPKDGFVFYVRYGKPAVNKWEAA